MATLTIELPDQARAFVEARVRSGEFRNPDEVVAAALVALENRVQAFNREAQVGIDAADDGRFVMVDDVRSFLAERRSARTAA